MYVFFRFFLSSHVFFRYNSCFLPFLREFQDVLSRILPFLAPLFSLSYILIIPLLLLPPCSLCFLPLPILLFMDFSASCSLFHGFFRQISCFLPLHPFEIHGFFRFFVSYSPHIWIYSAAIGSFLKQNGLFHRIISEPQIFVSKNRMCPIS